MAPDGEVLVEIEAQSGRVIASVSDQGPGIPADKRELVFRRFHSDRPEGESFGNHSGLGLAIARTIAEAHNGGLWVDDRADGEPGARLILDLPAA